MRDEERIVVSIRVRPPIGAEAYQPLCLRKAQNGQTVILRPEENASNMGETAQFQFDHVFDETDDQQVLYEECVQEMVDSALSGRNSTVFAYGQTGSGKTFTILGDTSSRSLDGKTQVSERSGVFIRVFDDLFRYRESVKGQLHIKITLSIIELYVEDVLDLLANKKKLKLRDSGEETFALGISLMEVDSIDDVVKYFRVANEFRSVSATKMNENSSRSHALFFIDLYQFPVSQFPTCPPLSSLVDANRVPLPNAAPGMARSRISLIDLAGSERVKKSGVVGQSMTEAQAINKSLSTLGTVINAMYTRSSHIPFRESKLTRLLKTCFVQANSRLLLIGQASPPSSSAVESLGTLRFCDRVKGLQAPAAATFPDPEEEERYLATKKTTDQLCADLRIASVLHYHRPVRVSALAAARGTSAETERHRVEQELRQSLPARAQQEEMSVMQLYQVKVASECDKEVEAFILRMNDKIEEYNSLSRRHKSEKKAWKKAKEEFDAQVEAVTLEEDHARIAWAEQQKRLLALRDAERELTNQSKHYNSFDEPNTVVQLQKKAAPVMPPVQVTGTLPPLTEKEEQMLSKLIEEFGQVNAEISRLQSTYIARIKGTRECRSEVRRMKMRSSAIVSEGTTVDDLIYFMITRAVEIAEGIVPERLRWTWADVDGCSTKLKGPLELHPPLLPRNRNSAFKRILGSTVLHHRKTFLSSDDSDEENSHYPAETRRQRNMNGDVFSDRMEEMMIMEDMEGDNLGVPPQSSSSTRQVPQPMNLPPPSPLPEPTDPNEGDGYASGEEVVVDDGSSVDSGEDEPAAAASSAWEAEAEDPLKDSEAAADAVVARPLPAELPRMDTTAAVAVPVDAAAPVMGHMEGGERRHRRRHRHHTEKGASAGGEEAQNVNTGTVVGVGGGVGLGTSVVGGGSEGLAPIPVEIHKGRQSSLSTDMGQETEPEDEIAGWQLNAGKPIATPDPSPLQEEPPPRRRRKHRRPAEESADPSTANAEASVSPEAAEGVLPEGNSTAPHVETVPTEQKSGLRDAASLMKVYDSPTLVGDLIRYMRGGTVMVKHGRMGKPHRRLFWVSSGRGKAEIIWMNPEARNADRSSVKLDEVAYIKLGCFSKVFRRHPIKPTTDTFFRCFTIGLKNESRTIDIVADTIADFEAWVVGLCWMVGVDPCWGGKPDITKENGFESLTFFESNLCESNYIMPSAYLTLKGMVEKRSVEVHNALKRYPNNPEAAQQMLNLIHPPALNESGAIYMTKGELRFLVEELKLDIFRISAIWLQLEQLNLIYDPKFVPATSFGVSFRV